MTAVEQILQRMKSRNTLLCVGLDPDLKKMPPEIVEKAISDEEKVLDFLCSTARVTAQHVCAFKVQKAFFDLLTGGHEVLRALIDFIHKEHPGISVIVDCKIGDTENTMAAYIHNLFDLLQADGIVVNPYLGDGVIETLAERADKAIVVLAKTSNPSGGLVQDVILQNGQMLWQHILGLIVNRWNRNGNMIPVISSTASLDMREIRVLISDEMPILLAGIGTQGGSYVDLAKLVNCDGIGVFVNSSRGILYPGYTVPWQVAVEKAAIELKEALNNSRRLA
jgi:orotidine-5'-phosphate decarboxylase